MVPRGDVVYLSTTRSIEENMDVVRRVGHTRFPLCEGDLDHIVGLIHIKDLMRAVSRRHIDETLSAETAKRIAEIRVSPEGREGIASFLEKRKASWCSPKS